VISVSPRTRKKFSALPSATCPSWVSTSASSKAVEHRFALDEAAVDIGAGDLAARRQGMLSSTRRQLLTQTFAPSSASM
jgi:hypothetical protein